MEARSPGRRVVPCMTLLGLALVLLAGSLGLGTRLYRRVLEVSRQEAELRLDPTGAARLVAANRALPPPTDSVARVVYFGDSRIEYWNAPPTVPGAESVNRGRGGETTAQLLERLDRDVLALGPRVVVLQAGINDLKLIGLFPTRERAIVEGCMDHLDTLVARLRARDVQVVALTVFPVGRVPWIRRPMWSERTRDAVAQVNAHLHAVAGPGLTVVDCDSVLADGRTLRPAYEHDTLHLSEAGYAALDALVTPALARAVAAAGGRE